jgi:hypothetical protein
VIGAVDYRGHWVEMRHLNRRAIMDHHEPDRESQPSPCLSKLNPSNS